MWSAKDFANDEVHIFESLVRVAERPKNLIYLAPFVVAGALAPADGHIEPKCFGSVQNTGDDISNIGLFGTPVTVVYEVAKHDDHAHDPRKLGTQSFVDTLILYELTNSVAGRARPDEGNRYGDFFVNHSFGSSFPSGHSSLTWSMTTVLADEYPSTKARLFWHAIASTVAASRVVGRRHFTSDVIVGSAMGYLTGCYALHAHRHHWSK